ncbi:hypothetical protein BJQ96_02587 [Flavobacterium sp. PL0002]|nr:tetratricopeptide repeat protein [Flavobacterium sp. PL002]MBE0392731.1 hypothetical protein [Flavobacterium sp. PL002]
MNVTDYTYLINKPDLLTEQDALELGSVLDEFPYFQSARALRLKGLYNQNSFKYNFALKVTAAHTTDRAVLFDFITGDNFTTIQKELFDKNALAILEIPVFDSILIAPEKKSVPETQSAEQSILSSIKEATVVEEKENAVKTEDKTAEEAAEDLEIGQPLDFKPNETHSFQEWLKLSRVQPIIREDKAEIIQPTAAEDKEKKKKAKLIDQFIKTSPKISPVKNGATPVIQIDINKEENSYLMTETLAKVYLEQKKYQKAIQAYDILILKYPEKSSFFADRISDIKLIQQNNN